MDAALWICVWGWSRIHKIYGLCLNMSLASQCAPASGDGVVRVGAESASINMGITPTDPRTIHAAKFSMVWVTNVPDPKPVS